MDIEERRLQELALLYFYFVKQDKDGTVDIWDLFDELARLGVNINENEIISDLKFLKEEGYIDSKELTSGSKIVDVRIEGINSIGMKIIEDPIFAYNISNNKNDNVLNVNVGSIQGNNNISNISQSINLDISNGNINQIERQIDKIQASLKTNNTEFKKYFDDLREQLKQKNKRGIENRIKNIVNLGFHAISDINTFVLFVSAIHGLLRSLH